MDIFITKEIPEAGIQLLKDANHSVTIYEKDEPISKEELIAECQRHQALLVGGFEQLDAAFFEECQHLKAVALMTVGFDHVDVKAAKEYNIPVSHTPNVLNQATADIAFLLMLATSRDAFQQFMRIKDGDWGAYHPARHLGQELYGKTLGIYGLGRIGLEMAKRSRDAYQMEIIYHNRSKNEEAEELVDAEYVSFEQLLKQSDVLSIHVPLTEETKHKFNKEAFEQMKPTSILVNTARGQVVQQDDLIEAIKNKTIWGAGLDVTDPEPLPSTNELLSLNRVCVLPHIGSATEETRGNMAKMAATNLIEVLAGREMPQQIRE